MRIVVCYGPKGGAGKTTLLAGLVGALAEAGRAVAVLDLDADGHGLTRFMQGRAERGLAGPFVTPFSRPRSGEYEDVLAAVDEAIQAAERSGAELMFIDTVSTRRALQQAACDRANLILTPVQESPLEIDLIAEAGQARGFMDRVRRRGGMSPEWLVASNRTPHLPTRLGRRMTERLAAAAEDHGFRFVAGPRERVLYREMFETGLTPFDPPGDNHPLTMSKLSAKAELRLLAAEIGSAA